MKAQFKLGLFLATLFVGYPVFGQGAASGGEPVRSQSFGQATLPTAQIRIQNLTRSAELFNILRNKRSVDESGLPTVGSIYIHDEFRTCQVFYKDELMGKYLYRHNAFNDEIEIRSTDLTDSTVSSLMIVRNIWLKDDLTNKKIGVMTFQNNDKSLRNGYLYPVVNKGEFQLYCKNQVKFTQGTVPTNSFNRPTPNRFSHFKKYFLKVANKPIAFELDKSKQSLL